MSTNKDFKVKNGIVVANGDITAATGNIVVANNTHFVGLDTTATKRGLIKIDASNNVVLAPAAGGINNVLIQLNGTTLGTFTSTGVTLAGNVVASGNGQFGSGTSTSSANITLSNDVGGRLSFTAYGSAYSGGSAESVGANGTGIDSLAGSLAVNASSGNQVRLGIAYSTIATIASGGVSITGALTNTGLHTSGALKVTGTPAGSYAADSWFVQNEGANLTRSYACGTNGSSYGQWLHYSATSTGAPNLAFTATNTGLAVNGALSASTSVTAGADGASVSYFMPGGGAIRSNSPGALYIDTAVTGGTSVIVRPGTATIGTFSSAGLTVSGTTNSTAFTNAGGALGTGAANAKNHFTQYNAGNAVLATGWIAAAFGDATSNRTVIGQGNGKAMIGGHSANLDAWADLIFGGSTYYWTADGLVTSPKMTLNTSTGVLTVPGNITSGSTTVPTILLNRNAGVGGISWYSSAYTAWVDYMAPSATASQGPFANITSPTGSLVTSWGRRSFIENGAGYGWTFESGTPTATTPAIMAEISSSSGAARFVGPVTASTFYNAPYDIANFINGKPIGSEIIMKAISVRKFTIASNFSGSLAYCTIAATGNPVFSILKNGVSVGTITFAAGATTGSFSATGVLTFNAGDVIYVTAPASADATLSDIAITFAGITAA